MAAIQHLGQLHVMADLRVVVVVEGLAVLLAVVPVLLALNSWRLKGVMVEVPQLQPGSQAQWVVPVSGGAPVLRSMWLSPQHLKMDSAMELAALALIQLPEFLLAVTELQVESLSKNFIKIQ
jgi:hypothetical protein